MESENMSLIAMLRQMDQAGVDQEDARRHLLFENYMHYEAREKGVPQMGVLELTPQCNFDCKMCYVHLQKEQMKGQQELPGDIWINLIDQAMEEGMMDVQLTGGEAMLHPDFDRIYLHLFDRGIRTVVMTNGLLLTEERIAFFKKYPPRSIQITLYGGDEECYERVTGYRLYGRVTEHIKMAKEIGCKICLAVTPSRYLRAEDVIKTIEFAREQELVIRVNNDLNQPNEETGRNREDFDVELEDYIRLRKMWREFVHGEVKNRRESVPEEGTSDQEVFGVKCGAGRSMFCITWKGEMKACLNLPFGSDPVAEGFRSSWQFINRQAEAWPIPAECMECIYSNICNRCPALHAEGARKGHADRRICARTKRLVAEGLEDLPEEAVNE